MRRDAVKELVVSLYPGATIERISHFGADDSSGAHEATEKGIGYGEPIRVVGTEASGRPLDLVIHTAAADIFGHDRRSDRAAEMLLAFDTFPLIPNHARALDVGAIAGDHQFRSLRSCGEFYLVTEYAAGSLYADDLREVAHRGQCDERDLQRVTVLADYLASLHHQHVDEPFLYRRAIRDLVGDGEGIFGIVDGYPDDVDAKLLARIREIERQCVEWRWILRAGADRCRRTHGDFHPFNILFDDNDTLRVLDAARGCLGDPADDAVCLAINFAFFAIATPGTWRAGFQPLWQRFWQRYLDQRQDSGLLAVAPPFLAWRALVLANPRWYPAMTHRQRSALLSLAERALEAGELEVGVQLGEGLE